MCIALNQKMTSSFSHPKKQPPKLNKKKTRKPSEHQEKGSKSSNNYEPPSFPTLQEIDYIVKNMDLYRPPDLSYHRWEARLKFNAAMLLIHTFLSTKSCSFRVFGELFYLESGKVFYSSHRNEIKSLAELEKINLTGAHFYRKIRQMVSEMEE